MSQKTKSSRPRSGAPAAGATLTSATSTVKPSSGIDPKWSWHYAELLSMREKLSSECSERRAESSHPIEHHPLNVADCASDEVEHDLLRFDLSLSQRTLYEVEAAIKRIQDGTYGVCEQTGAAIDQARLRAIPWARFGKEVEEKLEATGAIKKPHLGELGSVRSGFVRGVAPVDSDEEQIPNATDEVLHETPPPRGHQPAERASKPAKPPSKAPSRD